MEPIDRPGARIVVLDRHDRVLLLFYDDGVPHWVLPGGGLEAGETYEQAARRELQEELGVADVALRPLNWTRDVVASWGGRTYRGRESYFVTRVAADFRVELAEADDWRWWSLSELDEARAQHVVIWPTRLEEHVRAFLEHGPPREPVDLGR